MTDTTSTLLDVLHQQDPFTPFLLDLLFSESMPFDTSEIDFDEVLADMKLAPFVSPMVAGKAALSKGGSLKKFRPAYIKEKNIVNPEHTLTRRPGERIGGTMTPMQRHDAIVTDLIITHRKKIRRREEWMAWQVVLTGKVIVSGEDYPTSEVNFNRSTANTIVLTGTARWDQASADPLDDLEDWFTRLDAPCTHIIFGRLSFRAFGKHADVKEMLDTRRGSDTKLELAPAVLQAAYRGRLGEGGPECWTYSGYYHDDNDAKQLFVPENAVVLVSQGSGGVRTYGAILDGKAGYQASEFFPKNFEQDDPAVEVVLSQSAPLPLLRSIDSSLAATVL